MNDGKPLKIDLSERLLHFRTPARTSRGEYTVHRMVLVRLSDGKRTAVGECAPLPDLSSDRGEYDDLKKVYKLCETALNEGSSALRDYPALRFAVESALAELNEDPSLYDTAFARSECGIPVNGLIWMGDYEQMLSRLEEKLDAGWKCVKIKIGAVKWEDELKLLSLVRSRFNESELQLRVDANGAFLPQDASERIEELSRYGIHSIEQPIRAGQWEEMARLCRSSALPIALDEDLIGINEPEEKQKLLDTVHPQYLVLKPTLHGGLDGVREWVELAVSKGIETWITSALESNVGLKSIALLCASLYDINPLNASGFFPQGLGTGLLYSDNIDNGISLRGNEIWIDER